MNSSSTQDQPLTAEINNSDSSCAAWQTHQVQIQAHPLALMEREWTLTNGTGAYAMGTLPGVNTRRYHGLFVAATQPPVGRVVALSQMLEELMFDAPPAVQPPTDAAAGAAAVSPAAQEAPAGPPPKVVHFSACLFRDGAGLTVPSPTGHQLLQRFAKGLGVSWTYASEGLEWTRRLELAWKTQSAQLHYELKGLSKPAVCRLRPMLNLRDHHHLITAGSGGDWTVEDQGDAGVTIRHGALAVTISVPGAKFEPDPNWWYSLYYPADLERGQDHLEDCFVPGAFVLELEPAALHQITLTVSLGERADVPVASTSARVEQLERVFEHIGGRANGNGKERIKRALTLAADDFVATRTVAGEELTTIIAGFPWFTDWGRDTFIALPGLLLSTGRLGEARSVLKAFAHFIQDGLVPNVFDDRDDKAAHYNTVDASLWYVHSALEYLRISNDQEAWNSWLSAAVTSILDAYIRGTQFGIRMTGDGLITAGSQHTQLTWMDAACGGRVFTPRGGKAVEINALWYRALVGVADALGPKHPTADHYLRLAQRVKRSFAKVFWDENRGCLYDHVWTDEQNVDHPDPSIRPNQVLALSLPVSPLPSTKQKQILQTVQEKLLTPLGLRTLPSGHPEYHGRYIGNGYQRDEAYHQGTVWGWLIGPYAEAILRVGHFSPVARQQAREAIMPLIEHMTGRGLGQIPEIFDADEPHYPRGCVAQAWSVAEVLRVLRMIETGEE